MLRSQLRWKVFKKSTGFFSLMATFAAGLLIASYAGASEDSYLGAEVREQEMQAITDAEISKAPPAGFFKPGESPLDLRSLSEPQPPRIEPVDAFARAQSVLRHLGIPLEPESQNTFDRLLARQNAEGLRTVMAMMDPTGAFSRFMTGPLAASPAVVDVFQDQDSRSVRDFSVRLAEGAPLFPTSPDSFHQRLLRARGNSAAQPLAGLRIAIDPGHMGGAFWDHETGKAVRDDRGRQLSEGVLNLQVALLLEQSFKALGAEVLLTHRELGPVSTLDYAHLNLRPFALSSIRDQTLAPWFQSLLTAGNADSPRLFAAVDADPRIHRIMQGDNLNRDEYFVRGEDIVARANAINAFDADIALVIHFDAATGTISTDTHNATKVYVSGSFDAAEVSSREQRRDFAQHLLDAASWNASLALGRAVVGKLHEDLRLPFDGGGGGFSHSREPGVFSRNLGVSRRVAERALTYIECLYYNNATEFAALINAHHPMMISGESHPYSDRLVQVASAIQKGVQTFVAHYGE